MTKKSGDDFTQEEEFGLDTSSHRLIIHPTATRAYESKGHTSKSYTFTVKQLPVTSEQRESRQTIAGPSSQSGSASQPVATPKPTSTPGILYSEMLQGRPSAQEQTGYPSGRRHRLNVHAPPFVPSGAAPEATAKKTAASGNRPDSCRHPKKTAVFGSKQCLRGSSCSHQPETAAFEKKHSFQVGSCSHQAKTTASEKKQCLRADSCSHQAKTAASEKQCLQAGSCIEIQTFETIQHSTA